MIKSILLASALAMSSTIAAAEELPIQRVFAPPALNGPAAHGAEISPDGSLLTYLKSEPDDQTTFDLWARPVNGGEPRRLIKGEDVEPKTAVLSEAEKSRRERQRSAGVHGVTDFSWDEIGAQILVPASGNLYIADAKTGAVRKLGDTGGGAVDAKISPKGGYVTYIRDQNLHVLNLKSGRDTAITTEGKDTLSFGTAEFVAQEEMDRFTGYWTSPDDERIAFTRVDDSPVDIVPRLDIGADGATVVSQRYPRAGRPNAIVELYVTPITGGPRVKVDLGPNTDIYLARVAWSKDGKTLYVQRESRDQQTLDLLAVDPATGAARVLIAEHRAPWINLNDDLTPLKNGDFIWGSERTGFHHLYLYKADGTLIRPITQGEWPVASSGGSGAHPSAVSGVDEDKGLVYFVASKDSPLERHLYVTSYQRTESPKQITKGDGWWSADLAKDHKNFVGNYTDPRTPPQTALYSIQGERLSWIEENALKPGHPYWPYLDHKTYPEFGTLQAEDGETLHYAVTKPYGFDPHKHYPAIVSVYGGPHSQTVAKEWAGGTDQLITQAGYVLFRIDNRGSPNRGLKFESAIYKSMGGPEVADQLVGERFLASPPLRRSQAGGGDGLVLRRVHDHPPVDRAGFAVRSRRGGRTALGLALLRHPLHRAVYGRSPHRQQSL